MASKRKNWGNKEQYLNNTFYLRLIVRKSVFGFPTRSNTNQAVYPLKMARGLEVRIQEVEGLYYPCRENKGADQLRGYREADLRLCFRICKKAGFLITRLNFQENKRTKEHVIDYIHIWSISEIIPLNL